MNSFKDKSVDMPAVLRLGDASNFKSNRSVEPIIVYPTTQIEKGAATIERYRPVNKSDDNIPIISTEPYDNTKKRKHFIRRNSPQSNIDPVLNWTRPPI